MADTMAAVISQRVLIVAAPFERLSAERVVGALERGLREGDRELAVDVVVAEQPQAERLAAARAVVIAAGRLDERTLARSLAFEVATSARQAGVPAYAVTAENALDLFDARMLDLQLVVQASTVRALTDAGRKLAQLL
jgi:glycerate kinase